MRPCAESLIEQLGQSGPVLSYSPYEKTVLNGLARFYPDLADLLAAIVDRLVDLMPITKANYYHPDMHGSWSIKAVLPTIAPELDYADLDLVSEGGQAQLAFLEMIHPDTDRRRALELREALLDYCRLDTLAMVRLARFLGGAADRT